MYFENHKANITDSVSIINDTVASSDVIRGMNPRANLELGFAASGGKFNH